MSQPDRAWTTYEDLRRDLRRKWDAGLLLAEVAGGPSIFPYRFRLSRPTTAELSSRFEDVRLWVQNLLALSDVRVVMGVQGTRTIGRNRVPTEVWIDDVDAAASFLGESASLAAFRSVVELVAQRFPVLNGLLATHSMSALAVAADWAKLLDVADRMLANPSPNIYVRQVDIVGVDTKFIERHSELLTLLLDVILPPEAVCAEQPLFESRYGFRSIPRTIRLRALDRTVPVVAGADDRPVTLTLEDFGAIRQIEHVFITENYVNFLTFPPAARSIVVFGEGYDVGKISAANWVAGVPVHYWGDIDTHGFAILDLLRSKLPHVRSLLMDHATLHAHESQWGYEPMPVRRDLPYLTATEGHLYDDLRDNRIRANLRFEQERTRYGLIEAAVLSIVESP